jgi:hypothetical protein
MHLMTPSRQLRSIKTRLVVLYLVIVTALLACFGAFDYYKSRETLLKQQQSQVSATLTRLSESLPLALWDLDEKQIQKVLQAEMRTASVEGLFVVKDGKLAAGLQRSADGKVVPASAPPSGMLSQAVELSYDDNGKRHSLGALTLYYSDAAMLALLGEQMLRHVVQILVLDAALIVALLLGLRSVVLRPLEARRAGRDHRPR